MRIFKYSAPLQSTFNRHDHYLPPKTTIFKPKLRREKLQTSENENVCLVFFSVFFIRIYLLANDRERE